MKERIKNTRVVLIVDDEDSEIYLAESILKYMYEGETCDLIVLTAYNSDEVNQFMDEGIYIDLVLMDISLPNSKLNGIELAKSIRQLNGDLPPPIIGMLTTSGRIAEIEKSKEAKADFYLEKTEDIDIFENSFELIKKYYLDEPPTVDKKKLEKIFTFVR